MRRGEIWTASARGSFTGKPRPVLIVQNELANAHHSSIIACLLSAELTGAELFRIPIMRTPENGLKEDSEVQVDRIFSFRRDGFKERIGALSSLDLKRVEHALRRWLAL
jgi:mRNA interferase MazF